MATARRLHSKTGNNTNNDNNNQNVDLYVTPEEIVQSQYYDPISHYLDVLPHEYISSKTKSKHTTNNKTVFAELSRLFSSYPAITFKYMLDKLESKKLISSISIFNKPIDNVKYNNYIQYEKAYTLNKCRTAPFEYDSEITPPKELCTSLSEFMQSDKRLFIGFITLGLNPDMPAALRSVIRTITTVSGHMNSFIIDRKHRIIIHFEPKGITSFLSPWCTINIPEYLINSIDDAEMKREITTYQLVSTREPIGLFSRVLKKEIMPQGFDIYCQTYSLYAVLLYCLNMDLITKDKIFGLLSTITQEKAKLFQAYFKQFHLEVLNVLLSEPRNDTPYNNNGNNNFAVSSNSNSNTGQTTGASESRTSRKSRKSKSKKDNKGKKNTKNSQTISRTNKHLSNNENNF